MLGVKTLRCFAFVFSHYQKKPSKILFLVDFILNSVRCEYFSNVRQVFSRQFKIDRLSLLKSSK
jgi:hypothetical protein